jgi:hypothetical protein
MRRLALFLLATLTLHAQLALFTVTATGEVPLGSSYDFGRVAQGDSKDARFRARNTSNTVPLRIFNANTSGGAFSMVDRRSLPFDIPPGGFQDLYVRFTAGAPAAYSSALLVNSTNIALGGTSVAAPAFSVVSGCAFAGSAIDFGRLEIGQSRTCGFSLQNSSSEPLTISTLRVSGSAFQLPDVRAPLTVAASSTVAFNITFAASAKGDFAGTLIVETRSYTLTATAFEPAIPAPQFEFDRANVQSGQQVRLSLRLPSPPVTSASGLVTMSLIPDNTLAPSDPAVVFAATGAKTVPFTVRAGETQAQLGGQAFAVFQTGTTAGRLQFTLSGVAQGVQGDSTKIVTIAPALVNIDSATAARRPGLLDLQIVGFDNTYSAGAMTFSFYDRAGSLAGGSPIRSDFSSDFRSYFTRAAAGSTFRILLSFPVTGDAASIASAEVELVNSAGKATTQRLNFP